MSAVLTISVFLLSTPPSAVPKDVESIEQLASCEALAKCPAAQHLIGRGETALPALYRGLTHEKELVRFWICGVLSEIRHTSAFEPLLKQFQSDEKLRVRNAALFALGSLRDPRAIQPLSKAMTHKDPNVRIAGIMGLSLLKDKATIPVLRRAVSDRDEEVRSSALIALGEMQVQAAYEDMTLRLREDIKPSVRAAACVALAELGTPKAVAPMTHIVRNGRNIQVRAECAASLGRLGSPEAVPALVSVANEPDPLGGTAKWAIVQIRKANQKNQAP